MKQKNTITSVRKNNGPLPVKCQLATNRSLNIISKLTRGCLACSFINRAVIMRRKKARFRNWVSSVVNKIYQNN